MMPVSFICEKLHALAKMRGLTSLSMWLRHAADDAYMHDLKTEANFDGRIGIWDWDVGNDRDYANPVTAELFGLRPDQAASGLPIADYLAKLHPEDRGAVAHQLHRATKFGGSFEAEYRVIAADRVRTLRADGTCSIDTNGRVVRLMGSLVDITEYRSAKIIDIRNRT